MKLVFTCNGYHKITNEIVIYDLEITAADDMYDYFQSLFENNELDICHMNYTINIVLKELSWFKDLIFQEVVKITKKESSLYLIVFDWSTTDSDGIETFLYYHYEDAVAKFNELIEDECNPDVSWVGDEVFDENGDVNDGYDLDCNTNDKNAEGLYWHVVDENDYNRRSFIDLLKREIH